MFHAGHRHLSTQARLDRWLHHAGGRRRLAGLTTGARVTTLNCGGRLSFGTDCTATTDRTSIGGLEQAVINGSAVRDQIQVTAPPGLVLTVNALAGDDILAVMGAGPGSTVTVNAGEGDDSVRVGSQNFENPPASALAIQAPVTVDGGNGKNSLVVSRGLGSPTPVPAGGSATVTVTPTEVGAATGDTYFGAGGSLAYAGFDTMFMNGYDVDDTFRVTPSATTEITVAGGLQTTADTLDVNLTGTTGVTLDLAVTPNEIRFANRRTVKFSGFETRLTNGRPLDVLCTIRPKVQATVVPIGNGQLRATLRAEAQPATPGNELRSLRIARLANARLSLNGQSLQESQVVQLTNGTQEVVLAVERVATGLPATAQLVVTDACGEWPTFVGGGAQAFR